MHSSASKVIAILCIRTAISAAIEVLTEEQQQSCNNNNNNSNYHKNSSYELNIFNDFLDYNQLHRAIIIYTSVQPLSKKTATNSCPYNDIKDKFPQSPLIRKLTENYHIQFVNTLSPNSTDYLLRSLVPSGVGVFIKYNAKDKGKKMILKMVSQREKFKKCFKWLMVMKGIKQTLKDIEKELGNLNILLDADITVAVYRDEHILDLYDVYKICHKCGSPLEIVYKGNWTSKNGFKILKEFHYGIAIRRNNFKNFAIKATTAIVNKSPTLNMSNYEYLNNDKIFLDEDAMQRKTYQLLKLMENLFNFTFDIHFTKDWGAQVNGSWTGMMGLVYNQQTDMSLCPMRYLLQRLNAFQYSRNIHTEKIHFLFRHPKHASLRNIFFEPLTDTVWWCVLALIFVAILLLTIHVHAEYKMFTMLQKQQQVQQANITDANAVQLPMLENHFDFIVLCIVEAILMQGPAPELFRHNSTRLLVVSVSIFSILLMQFYGAFIVSSLLSEAPRTITNLQALYDSSLEMGMENISYNYDIFINNINPMVHQLYKHRICNQHTRKPNAMTLEEGAKRIGKGNFAFHVAIDRAYRVLETFLTESQFCDLQEINFHPRLAFTSGIIIRKSSPYYEFITFAIAKFQEAALLAYNNKKWEVTKIDCTAVQNEKVEVDLEHFAPALAFLLFAILICLLTLVIEIIYKQFALKLNL